MRPQLTKFKHAIRPRALAILIGVLCVTLSPVQANDGSSSDNESWMLRRESLHDAGPPDQNGESEETPETASQGAQSECPDCDDRAKYATDGAFLMNVNFRPSPPNRTLPLPPPPPPAPNRPAPPVPNRPAPPVPNRAVPTLPTRVTPSAPMSHRLWEIARRIMSLSPGALDRTVGFINRNHRIILNKRYVTIIDYTQSSAERRMYVIDLYRGAVERHQVTHGSGSGDRDFARYFTDWPGSLATSVGAFLTANSTDVSERVGFRLVLHGMESTNQNALARGIVMHGSWYASEEFFASNGRVLRSEGCPAIDPWTARRLLPRLAGGSLLYHYGGTPALDRRYRTVSL